MEPRCNYYCAIHHNGLTKGHYLKKKKAHTFKYTYYIYLSPTHHNEVTKKVGLL